MPKCKICQNRAAITCYIAKMWPLEVCHPCMMLYNWHQRVIDWAHTYTRLQAKQRFFEAGGSLADGVDRDKALQSLNRVVEGLINHTIQARDVMLDVIDELRQALPPSNMRVICECGAICATSSTRDSEATCTTCLRFLFTKDPVVLPLEET
jgi:hypothetical protein